MLPLTTFLYCLLFLFLPTALLSVLFLIYYWYELRSFRDFPTCHWVLDVIPWLMYKYGSISYTNFIFQILVKASKRYQKEGLFVVWFGKLYVYIYGEEIMKLFLKHPDAIDKIPSYAVLEYYLGKGLLTSNGEEWKKQRKTVNPSFHGLALKDKLQLMNENALLLLKELRDTNEDQVEDTMKIIKFTTLRIFFEAVLGKRSDEFKNNKRLRRSIQMVESLSYRLTKRLLLPWLHNDFLRPILLPNKGDQILRDECANILVELLDEKMAIMESHKSDDTTQKEKSESCHSERKLFAERLIEKYMKDPSMTKEDIYGQFVTMTVGGFDTTSHAIMWTLFMLALHPSVQEEAYNEVTSFNKESLEYEDLCNLKYLECVFKETLRIYPAIPMYGRLLKRDLKYGPYKIPKNTPVNVLMYSVHRNPDIYPDPEKFDPGRFIHEDTNSNPKLFVPFAEGIRTCVGKNYAMMEMKILFFHILKNFRILTPDRREDIDISYRIMLSCTKQPRLQFIKRKS